VASVSQGRGEFEAPNLTPPPGNPRFPLFDSLRAVAALTVFVGHTMTLTNAQENYSLAKYAPQLAAQGVAVFFLISGFLLYRPFVQARFSGKPLRVRDYARRRVLRIVPAYWVALTVVIIVYTNAVALDNAWIFYGFAQIYDNDTYTRGLGPAWTLCIEVTFYAALPLLAVAAAKLARDRHSIRGDLILVGVLAVVSLVVHAVFYDNAELRWIAGTLPGTFLWFALGMGLAVVSVSEHWQRRTSLLTRSVVRWPTLSWLAGIGVFVILCTALPHANAVGTGGPGEFVLYGLVSFCILLPGVFGDAAPGYARSVLRLRALSWLGLVSYSFYLYHALVIQWISQHATHVSHRYLYVLVLSFVVTCLIAAASYYVIERPILQLKNLPLRTVVRNELARVRAMARSARPRIDLTAAWLRGQTEEPSEGEQRWKQ
jgi:peptidoglycan/LPS O-acetylase OafA/YrhL